MISCWKFNPGERPAFFDLVQSVEDLIKPLAKYMDFTVAASFDNSD